MSSVFMNGDGPQLGPLSTGTEMLNEGMSSVFMNGDGPQLGPLSTGTEMLNEGKMKPPGKLSLTTPGAFVDLKKKSKVFSEGPNPPPLSPISHTETDLTTPDLNYIKQQSLLPLDKTYTDGLVKQTEKEGVVELAENLQNIKRVPTGAIIEEGFVPTGDQYTENVHYVVEKNLAKGSFGTTALCVDSWKRFIRKKIKKAYFRSSEVAIPANLNHDNVTKLYGLILRQEEDGDQTVELMIEPAGEALTTFTKNNSIDTPKIWDIAKQTMAGLNHLHLYGIIHLNIKPDNICAQMKGSRLLVKITNFGSAKLPQEGITFFGMTPEYMASEISQLNLQERMKFERVIKEGDITGKVDVFAAALVIMFLYLKVHVLQRFITGGKTLYSDITQRQKLRLDFMYKLATDQDFIRLLVIPDKCDVDMRDLLIQMTHYDHHSRLSAQEVMDFINKRERRLEEVLKECKLRLAQQREEKERMRVQEPVKLVPNVVGINLAVPDIAQNCMELGNGTIQMQTKDKLRKKLMPYAGKGKGKFVKEETPMQEMRRMEAVSKRMEEDEEFRINLAVPDIAQTCMELGNGTIRQQTKAKLRKKLRPYAGKGKGKFVKEETPMQEMRRMEAASKCMEEDEEFLSPPTLVIDVSVSLKKEVSTSERKAIVTQPLSEETHQGYQPKFGASRPIVLNHAQPVTQTSAPRHHAQPTPQLACAPFSQQPRIQQPVGCYESNRISVIPDTQTTDATMTVEQKNQARQEILHLLMTGKVKIAQGEKGPRKVCESAPSTTPTRKGVVPFNPTSPLQPSDEDSAADGGNVPNFMRLC